MSQRVTDSVGAPRAVRLYNSLTRSVDPFEAHTLGVVGIYTCGPTVYRYAHIGNLRSFLFADVLRRTLLYLGYGVRHVKNITDVGHMRDDTFDQGEDRMELAAEVEGKSPAEISDFYTRAWLEDEAAINILPVDVYPKATEHIEEMIELTERLIERGLAYEVGGNVYFDVHAFPDYGKLSGNTIEALRAGHRQELEVDPNKRHPEDFALWKRAGENRLMKWPSPWGEGFPGWHIECS
ncbi:MAG: cysteine--tRNA ligase, partial [Chloroflexi bacterium]